MIIYKGNTTTVVLRSFKDGLTKAAITDAIASFTIKDMSDVALLENVSLTYDSSSKQYVGVIPSDTVFTDINYKLLITAVSGTETAFWEDVIEIMDRKI